MATDGNLVEARRATRKMQATDPRVTIVVTPRERFGVSAQALDSIYETADIPFDLVYVDGSSPRAVSEWIAEQARARGFTHVRKPYYLSPNEARNLGVAAAPRRTEHIIFIENDVICAPGWLSRLLETADESGADVVAPLTCHGLPLHTNIHQAGADFSDDVAAFLAAPPGTRILFDKMHLQGRPTTDAPTTPVETQCCEFHCVLVRRSAFDRIGGLDEEMLSTKEHIEFSLGILSTGGKVMLEPRSVVTYLFPSRAAPMTRADWPYFVLRWNEQWQHRSLDRLAAKWGLDPAQPYIEERKRKARWRYNEGMVKPFARANPVGGGSERIQKLVNRVFSKAIAISGNHMARRYDARRAAEAREQRPAPPA